MIRSQRAIRRCRCAVIWALPCMLHAVTVTLDPGQRFQTMDGFGASAAFYENWLTAYPAAAKQQIYDTLFRDSGMTILRVRVYPDLWPSSTGALSWSWTTHQREIIDAARARGVTTVWATCWSPPAWMKDNGSLNGGNLRTDRYDAYAVFITSYVVGMRDLYGIPIAGVSIFNEPGFGTSYDSTLTPPNAYRDILTHIGAYAAARQVPLTFFCCDTMDINNTTWGALGRGYVPTLLADATAAALTDRIITHQYGAIDADRWHDLKTLAHAHGKVVWESEMSKLSGATHDMEEALEISRWMWIAIASGDAAAWHYWQYFWPYDAGAAEGLIDIYNPWSGDGASGRFTVPKRYHAMRQWSRHVRPGYVRIRCTSDDARVPAAAFTGTSTTVVVLMNRSSETLTVLVRGFSGAGTVQYVRTTATENYAAQQPILSSAGVFSAVVPGRCIATFSVNAGTSVPGNLPPSVALTSPVQGSSFTAPATVALTATASDSDGTVTRVEFWMGTTLLNADSASPYAYNWTEVGAGGYALCAIAYDNQGATSTSTVVTVTVLSSSTPAVWYTLTTTVNPANGGTVSPASGTYLAGSQIQVTATPNANYTFSNWSGDAMGTNPTITLTMDADKSITANFRAAQSPQPAQPELSPGDVRIVGGQDGYINATTNPNVVIRFRRILAGVVTVRIYDLRGRLVMEKTKDGPADIDDHIAWNTADLPTGVYIARVRGGEVETFKRVVILR